MFSTIVSIISAALICGGLFFFFGAAVGLLRFPDFYTRMHAAGKGDTLSTIMILLGIALYQFHDFFDAGPLLEFFKQFDFAYLSEFLEHFKIELLVAIKVIGISVLIMLTSPTSTHALMEAGYDDGVEPFAQEDDPGEQETQAEGTA